MPAGSVTNLDALILARFIHRDLEAALRQFMSGGETGDAGAKDRDGAAPPA